ncbi:sodium:proton exchanger [Fischerella thermalis CCMEE 5282]|uniref:sodium:calcium antiporter n=1 Tax=Fischerella thermalis TaxID=372787 RepID=UPI000C7FB123|nr:sodium:proton exchanger [Fischerella thermalis]PMB12657.1 sodium:proton exchanger [Fischerella thermalis CCMEE 5282]
MIALWILAIIAGVAAIVWGAETFAKHLGEAAVRLQISSFALALLLAGAEPEELATTIAATLKDALAIAFGDVIGANIAVCLVALGVGAIIAPLPFGKQVMRYALFGLPIGVAAVGFIWDGQVTRIEGAILLALYILYLGMIWIVERQPPAMGETEAIEEAAARLAQEEISKNRGRVGKELLLVVAGLAAMTIGSLMLVEAVRQITNVEATQTTLSLTVVGFATAFELVILCWSAARKGATEVVIAGVVGSFAYNVTMTLGAASVIRPLNITDATLLHKPAIAMLLALVLVIVLATPTKQITQKAGWFLVGAYPVFLLAMFWLSS